MAGREHRGENRSAARLRVVVAVFALYGLVLQAFLSGLAPLPVQAGTGILCATHVAEGDGPVRPHIHPCCTIACPDWTSPSPPIGAEAAWPARRAVRVIWHAVAVPPARGPPDLAVWARGPPHV